jgi:hypothetical protein
VANLSSRSLSSVWYHRAATLTKEYLISHIRILICRLDDPASDQITELAAFDLPATHVTTLQPETALDDLETITYTTANAIVRRILQTQSETIDATLVAQHRQAFSPAVLHADGHEMVTVASRFGTLMLSRQVCQHLETHTHVLPSNAILPPHKGMIITRGLPVLGLLAAPGTVVYGCGARARPPRPTSNEACRIPPSAPSCASMDRSFARPSKRKSAHCSSLMIWRRSSCT